MDNLGMNYFYASFDNLGCQLFRTTCWTCQSVYFTDQNRQTQKYAFEKGKCDTGKNEQLLARQRHNMALVFHEICNLRQE